MEPISLTAKQIKEVDENTLTKRALKEALEVALCYYSNQLIAVERESREWWEEMLKIYNLDRVKKHYYRDGKIYLKEGKDKD